MIFFFPHRNSTVYNPLFPVNNTLLIHHFIFIALSIRANLPSFISAIFNQSALQNYANKIQSSCPNQPLLQISLSAKDWIQWWREIILLDCWDIDTDISFFSPVVWYRSQDYKIFSSKFNKHNTNYTTRLRVHRLRKSACSLEKARKTVIWIVFLVCHRSCIKNLLKLVAMNWTNIQRKA